jgi:hypothetical protein
VFLIILLSLQVDIPLPGPVLRPLTALELKELDEEMEKHVQKNIKE